MRVVITIDCDNAAFEAGSALKPRINGAELSRILRDLAERFDGEISIPELQRGLYDINGNKCGKVDVQ